MIQSHFRIFAGLIAICFFSFIISRVILDSFFSRHQAVQTIIYSHQQQILRAKQKLMLMWTTFFSESPENRLNLMNECPDLKLAVRGSELLIQDKCMITADRSLVDNADAVIFHFMTKDFRLNDLPKRRFPSQRYVFLTVEAPPTYKLWQRDKLHAPPNFFNWTMTYRYDSDVPWVYGGYWVSPEISKRHGFKSENLPYDEETILKNKSNAIFWLVSNCNTISKRELAVEKLEKYITVDKYGACSDNPYKRDACKRTSECEKRLGAMNFFYIAIENTVCKNYVTEKYFDRYRLPSIPIVMRRKTYENLVPSHSFIPMDDFESAQSMANYLNTLMSNKTAYLEYFKWRNDGWVRTYQNVGYRFHFCKLCEALLEERPTKIYENVEEWFHGTSECEGSEFAEGWKED
uniref:Fucosyltransferase n=1 Tax=Elaeophora elaphi TaxID=1147741 RepID=A0A0R3RFQ5_9BILA